MTSCTESFVCSELLYNMAEQHDELKEGGSVSFADIKGILLMDPPESYTLDFEIMNLSTPLFAIAV